MVPTEDYRDYLTERQISKLEGVFLRYDRRNTGALLAKQPGHQYTIGGAP